MKFTTRGKMIRKILCLFGFHEYEHLMTHEGHFSYGMLTVLLGEKMKPIEEMTLEEILDELAPNINRGGIAPTLYLYIEKLPYQPLGLDTIFKVWKISYRKNESEEFYYTKETLMKYPDKTFAGDKLIGVAKEALKWYRENKDKL